MMKKTPKQPNMLRKLTLGREVIAQLESRQLRHVAGGELAQSPAPRCGPPTLPDPI